MSDEQERAFTFKIDARRESPRVPPRIAAAFLVNFDPRKGYVIAWSKSVEQVEVDGVVEFKSLPSGLHNVREDLVYFVHNEYAGVSAFFNEPDPQLERNAQMLAVGVLVPLEQARMGKIWLHAEALKDLAKRQITDWNNHGRLEGYWERHRMQVDSRQADCLPDESSTSTRASTSTRTSSDQKPGGYRRQSRANTDVLGSLRPDHALPPYHPVLSLPRFIDSFGPLAFLLYKTALLRKRILIVGEAPVHENCNLVYNLSLISSISHNLLPLLPIDGIPDLRLRPWFNIGVQDIPSLT